MKWSILSRKKNIRPMIRIIGEQIQNNHQDWDVDDQRVMHKKSELRISRVLGSRRKMVCITSGRSGGVNDFTFLKLSQDEETFLWKIVHKAVSNYGAWRRKQSEEKAWKKLEEICKDLIEGVKNESA